MVCVDRIGRDCCRRCRCRSGVPLEKFVRYPGFVFALLSGLYRVLVVVVVVVVVCVLFCCGDVSMTVRNRGTTRRKREQKGKFSSGLLVHSILRLCSSLQLTQVEETHRISCSSSSMKQRVTCSRLAARHRLGCLVYACCAVLLLTRSLPVRSRFVWLNFVFCFCNLYQHTVYILHLLTSSIFWYHTHSSSVWWHHTQQQQQVDLFEYSSLYSSSIFVFAVSQLRSRRWDGGGLKIYYDYFVPKTKRNHVAFRILILPDTTDVVCCRFVPGML